jgi:hypothetical protein
MEPETDHLHCFSACRWFGGVLESGKRGSWTGPPRLPLKKEIPPDLSERLRIPLLRELSGFCFRFSTSLSGRAGGADCRNIGRSDSSILQNWMISSRKPDGSVAENMDGLDEAEADEEGTKYFVLLRRGQQPGKGRIQRAPLDSLELMFGRYSRNMEVKPALAHSSSSPTYISCSLCSVPGRKRKMPQA